MPNAHTVARMDCMTRANEGFLIALEINLLKRRMEE